MRLIGNCQSLRFHSCDVGLFREQVKRFRVSVIGMHLDYAASRFEQSLAGFYALAASICAIIQPIAQNGPQIVSNERCLMVVECLRQDLFQTGQLGKIDLN